MRDLHYKVRSIRINDLTWELLKKKRSGKSWNLFLLDLLKKNETKQKS